MPKAWQMFIIFFAVVFMLFGMLILTPLQEKYLNTRRVYEIEFSYESNAPFDMLHVTNSMYRIAYTLMIERGVYRMKIEIENDPNFFVIVHYGNETHKYASNVVKEIEIKDGLFVAIGYLSTEYGRARITLERVSWP